MTAQKAAIDSSMIDATAEVVNVAVDGARLLCIDLEQSAQDAEMDRRLLSLPLPELFGRKAGGEDSLRRRY